MPPPTGFFCVAVCGSPKSSHKQIFCASPKSSHKQTFSPTEPYSGSFRMSNPLTPNGRAPTPPYNFPGRATKEEALEDILKGAQGASLDAVENVSFEDDSDAGLVKKEESPQERQLLAERLRLFVSSNHSLDTSDAYSPS